MGQRLVEKSKNLKKKKNSQFFFTSVLRPAHYTLGTLLGPKSQKKQELSCFEHLEFIPRPFSAPPVHFVWASALSKNRKISKKKIFFSGKFRPLSWVFGHQKVQKNAKIGCFDDLGVNHMHYAPYALLQGPQFRLFLSKFRHNFFFFDFGKGKSQAKRNHPDNGSLGVQRCQKTQKKLMF